VRFACNLPPVRPPVAIVFFLKGQLRHCARLNSVLEFFKSQLRDCGRFVRDDDGVRPWVRFACNLPPVRPSRLFFL
jgi:hypothetical protein